MRRKLLVGIAFGLSMFFMACSGYDQLLKSTDVNRQYAEAMRYYNRQKYKKALGLFEKVLPMSRATNRGDTVMFYLADCYTHDHDYMLAGYTYEQFMQNYPKSPFYEEASFLSAHCSYKVSPRYSLDQEYTRKAITGFQFFKETFPRSERVGEANHYLDELFAKLQQKEFMAAKMYYRQEKYRAAIAALKGSLERFPQSPYREEQLFLVLKSSFLYAENSIYEKQRERYQQTVDEYLTFFSECSQTKYAKEAATFYRKSMKFLGKQPDESVMPQ